MDMPFEIYYVVYATPFLPRILLAFVFEFLVVVTQFVSTSLRAQENQTLREA